MTLKFQIYKCDICGNIVQILQEGDGNLVCCEKEMTQMHEQYDNDELGEKHTPKTVQKADNKTYVNVIGHPMDEEHYIQFIQTYSKDKKEIYTKFFNPNECPEADISFMGENTHSVEYCNIHGLWGDNVMLKNEQRQFSI